jgi:hypothetical protein
LKDGKRDSDSIFFSTAFVALAAYIDIAKRARSLIAFPLARLEVATKQYTRNVSLNERRFLEASNWETRIKLQNKATLTTIAQFNSIGLNETQYHL